MNKHELHGSTRHFDGKVEKTIGDAVDSRDWKVAGVTDQVAGSAEHPFGRTQSVAAARRAQAQVSQAKADFVQTKNEAVAKAKQAADAAAGAGAKTSFLLVLALLNGAGASAFGATAASRRRLR